MSGRRPGRRNAAPAPSPEAVLERFRDGPVSGVFTDGACEGNPGPGGWAFVRVEEGELHEEASGFDPATTNNRMELRALIEAFRALPADARTVVHSDSELCVKTVNEWAAGWEQRGWRRRRGEIANLELVQELYGLAKAHPHVELRWIRAHDGSRWNEYVDALANEAIRNRRGRG